ncbi:MAG: molybdopterin-dependent oxidoreductase [Lachnospiraceae bacterium]|nr:molybdopterin-dependent oxidoreductase [Lachnospiraceae bacterium]
MKTYWKRSVCPYDCPDECGLLIKTNGKRVFQVKGDPKHPVTKGFVCRKMNHYEKTIHNPDRILTPLKRIGKKGEGHFEPISWHEALENISDHWKQIVQQYGAQSILPYSYGGNEHTIQNKSGEAFFYRLGASNLERTICAKAKGEGYKQILGATQGTDPSAMENSDFIIIWGCNAAATYIHAYQNIVKAKKKGAHIVLIETYQTPVSSIADEIYLVKPGSDGALALCIAYYMKENHMLNYDFMKKYVYGWEEFLDSLDHYVPETLAEICGLESAQIEWLANTFSKAQHPSILIGSGLSRHGNGAMNVRCIIALQALSGALGDRFGGVIGELSTGYALNRDLASRPDWRLPNTRTINMNQIGDALCNLDPPIKSIYIYNVNPANTAPGQAKIITGLKREDLFTVVHERFMTDTARYADIILPADTSVEHSDLATPYGHPVLQRSYKVIDPLGEAKSNWDVFCLLAEYMGFEETMWKLSCEELADQIVDESPQLKQLWNEDAFTRYQNGYGVLLPADDPLHFKTPSGKIELINERLGREDRIPHYKGNYGGKYPLSLVSAPHVQTLNSTFTDRKDLIEKRGNMCLMIHPNDADERGIKDGNFVKAYNDHAEVIFKASVTEKVKQGSVIAEGVFQSGQSYNGLTVNALMSQKLTDYGNASTLNDNTIEIEKTKFE